MLLDTLVSRKETAKITTDQDPNVIKETHQAYKTFVEPTLTVNHEQKPIQINSKASD
jgi:hypothetical protein